MANGLPPLEKLKKKELPPLNSLKKKGDGTPQPETTSQPTGVITQPLAQGSQQGTQPPVSFDPTSINIYGDTPEGRAKAETEKRKAQAEEEYNLEQGFADVTSDIIKVENLINELDQAQQLKQQTESIVEFGTVGFKQGVGVEQMPPKETTITLSNGITVSIPTDLTREQAREQAVKQAAPTLNKKVRELVGVDIIDEQTGEVNAPVAQYVTSVGSKELEKQFEFQQNKIEQIVRENNRFQSAFKSGVLNIAGGLTGIVDPKGAQLILENAQTYKTSAAIDAGLTEQDIENGIVGNLTEGNFKAGLTNLYLEAFSQTPQLALMYMTGGTAGIGILGASAGGAEYARLYDRVDISNGEKMLRASLIGITEALTERLGSGDINIALRVLGQKEIKNIGIDVLKNIKSPFSKQFLEEGGEELIAGFTEQLINKIADGEDFDVNSLIDQALIGGVSVTPTTALAYTVSKGQYAIASKQNQLLYSQGKEEISSINEALNTQGISQEEKDVLTKRKERIQSELLEKSIEDLVFYNQFSEEDLNRVYDINEELTNISAKKETALTDVAKTEYDEQIKTLAQEKQAIENKYVTPQETSSKTGEILDTEKPQPNKVTILGKEVNQYNNYIPEKTEDVEEDAIYTFTSDNKEGIPEVLREKANVNKADIEVKNKAGETVRTEKKESWSASINGKELIDLFEQQKTQQEQKTDETAKQEEPMLEGVQATRDETKVGQESAELRTEETAQKEVVEPLKDIESTSKALEGKTDKIKPKVYAPKNKRIVSFNIDNEGVLNRIKSTPVFNAIFSKSQIDKLKIGNNTVELNMTAWGKAERMLNATDETNSPKTISEAYHKAKKDGSNPELVKAVEDLLTPKTTKSDTQDKAGIPSKEQKGQEPKQAKPKQEASGEKAETGRDVQTPKEKGRVTPDKTKEEVRVEPDEKEVKEVAEKAGITPKNLKDLYKINRDMFGLNKVKAFANAVVMDRMIGAMAKRAGVSKQEMYGKISFKKGSVAPKGSLKQAASNIWKSTAKEGISKIQQKAATPEQWVKMINDKGGKGTSQELEWIGLADFLSDYVKENNVKSVPKEVVEQYIADNQIEIVDVSKGDLTPKEIQKRDNIQEKINRIGEKIVVARLNGNEELVLQLENEQEQLFDELKPLSDLTNRTVTRYSQYTLEGGENYREVLLTLPNNKKSDQKFYKKQHFDEANILAHLRLNERTLPNGERVLFIEEVQSDWAQEGKKKGFGKREKITENDIEIISDEKEYYDSEMMGYDHRVKFRVKGFDDIDSVTYNDGLNSKERSITDLKKRLANDYNRELLQEGRTPDMPYKKTDQWVGMAMRRAMQMAANEGFDRIAWVTGEQSADRYSLKEKVNSISVAPNESGRFVFIDMKGNYDVTLNVDDNGKIIEDKNNLSGQQSFKGKQLEDVVGKDMADKILSQKEENKFEGQGLEVGGEGMKAFYNSILPKVAKKEAQRFDKNAKVEVADFGGVSDAEHAENIKKVGVYNRIVAEENNFMDELNVLKPTEEQRKQYEGILKRKEEARKNLPKQAIVGEQGRGMADYPLENNTPSKQLSIAITPKMRMNLNGAVPLFQGEQGAMLAEDGKYIIYALTDPNVSTPLHELAHVFEHYLTEAERTSVLKWAGATEWTTEVSEKFARGFEKYLADGKAPTVSLQKIFNRFKEWLTDIYNGIVGSDIDIQLNDEMRDLYGKMLGVDAVKEQEKKSFANIIRGLKIDTTGKAFDATLGLPVAIYNNAIEITAKAVEAGVEVKKAIQKGIDYANKKMNGKKWDVEGFRNQLLTTIKGQFEQQAAQMRSSKKEVKTPKTRFLGFLTRSGAKIVNANDYIDSMKTNMNLDVSDTKKRIDDAKSKARKVFAKTNKIKNDKEVANIVNDLLNRIISPDEYNMTAQEAIDKIRKDIKNPKVAQELIDAGLDIRTQIDNMTKFMLENAEKFNLSDEAIENLKSNIGNYIHREYMFFSERGKTFRKQSLKTRRLEKWNPTDEMINEAIAEHAIYNGISVDEAKKQIEDLIEDWKKKRTPIKVTGNNVIRIQDVKVEADLMKGRVRIPQNFTLFSEASKEAEKELQKKGIDSENKNYNTLLSVETERIYKDKGGEYVELPPHLRKLLGEERNATQRYINTMLAMSNMVYKAQAMDMIVKSFDGKDGWIYDKEPANNKGDYKLVNDKYSPLNGKWVNIYLIEEFNKLPIYETDLAIAKAYFEYQSLVRTTKTVANSPTNFKNVIGGIFAQMQNGFFIALTNPKLAALSIYSRGHLYLKGRRNELAKQVLKDGAEAGVLSSSVDVEVLGLKGSILSERVKFGKSELGRRYAQQDDWTKSLMVYLYKQDVSLMLFGKKFDDLSKDQQKEVLIKTGSLTKKGVPTFSNLPSWFRTISRLPTGDFMSFTVEATRSLIGSGIIAYEHARAASTGVDSKGNTINETQRRAYAKDAAKRIAGLVAIQSVGKAIGAGAFSLGGSAIEYGSQVFAAIFGGGDDEDENDETKLAKTQVVKEINKTIPDWAVGDRVIVTNVDDDGNVTFYNWTGLEPSSETAQLIGGNFKYFEQFYKGSITAKMLIQLYNNENEIGNEIYLEDEPLYKQVFNSAYFLGKNTLLPPFINSTEYEIKRRKEDDENFGVISQDNTVEENAQSAKELTQVFLSRATIRSYNYNIYNRVKQIAYAQSRHGRVDNLDNIKEEEQIDLRLKNISVIRDAYQICLKHRITTPDSPAKIKKISELNDAVKRNYTDFEEAMIYETDDAKFKEMYDFVMSKSKDIVEYNKLKDERKK